MLPQPSLVDRVEIDERLVEEHEGRIMEERGREHELLARPFRQVLAEGRPLLFQIEEREPAFDSRLEGVHSAYPSDEVEVLPRGEVRRRRLDLGHDPDEGLHAQGLPDDVDAEDAGVSRARPELAREDPEERRLPRAVRAEESEELPRLDREVDASEGLRPVVALPQAEGLDRGHEAFDEARVI